MSLPEVVTSPRARLALFASRDALACTAGSVRLLPSGCHHRSMPPSTVASFRLVWMRLACQSTRYPPMTQTITQCRSLPCFGGL